MNKLNSYIVVCVLLSACDEENSNLRNIAPDGDYFPLADNSTWTYESTTSCNCKCPCNDSPLPHEFSSHSYSVLVDGDTLIDDKTYKKVYLNDKYYAGTFKRRDGSKYYIRNAYETNETIFLDTNIPVGGSWTQFVGTNNTWKIENTILSVASDMIVKKKSYKNVILVKEVTRYSDTEIGSCGQYTIYHYYAEGIGEIFSHRPYNPCTYYSGNDNVYLTGFTK
jgi:hypothetical protein